jgi:hypothetical protein
LLISSVSSRSRKKKKRRLFCVALVAGTVNKLEQSILRLRYLWSIAIESIQNRLLKVCYVPATSTSLPRLLFLLWPLTILMKQTRQAVPAVKQSKLLKHLWLCQLKYLFIAFPVSKFLQKV